MRPALAVLIAATLLTPLLAQSRNRNLWVGVLTSHSRENGKVVPDIGAEFEPVGALVDGNWHFEPENDALASTRLHRTFGRIPAQWLPLGRELPRRWRGWLTDGRVEPFELSGPFRMQGVFDTYRIATSIRVPRRKLNETVAGIAVSGDLAVYPFAPFGDLDDERRDAPPEAIRRAMLNTEVREIATTLSRLQPGEEFKRALADVPLGRLSSAGYTDTSLRTATTPDGARLTMFEGSKALGLREGCTGLHSGGAMAEVIGREPTVLGTWTYLVCDELHVDHLALAVIERHGRSCWLMKYQYEDGVKFLLRPAGVVDYLTSDAACDIR